MSGWSPPKRLGKYELVEPIGQGGMGAVWRARQAELGRDVAIKVMLAGEHASEEMLARFRREARLAAKLQDPGIVTVFDVGQEGALHYFVMELVQGQSLKDLLGGGPLPVERAIRIAVDAAKALAAAHDVGVIHRDVKPGNILIDRKGRVRIADFGLARDVSDARLTATGTVFGTPSYMAPEQAGGDVSLVSARSDVYSLGAVLYEMLTGRPPFEGSTLQVLRQIESQTPPAPSSVNRAVPREVEAVVMRALAKDPAVRFADARAFAIALESPSSMMATVVRPRASSASAGRGVPVWVAVVALLVPIGVWLLLRKPGPGPNPQPPSDQRIPIPMAKEAVGLRRVLDGLSRQVLRWAAVGAMALPSDESLEAAEKEEPDTTRKAALGALRLAYQGDADRAWERVLALGRGATRSDPDVALVFAELALLRYRWTSEQQRLTEALDAVASFETPDHVAMRAVLLISAERREEADAACRKLDSLVPDSPVPHLTRALFHQGGQELHEALLEFAAARVADPGIEGGGYATYLEWYARFHSGDIDADKERSTLDAVGDERWPMTHLLRAWARLVSSEWEGVWQHMTAYERTRPRLWPALEPYELHELAAAGTSRPHQALAAVHTFFYLHRYDDAIAAGSRAVSLAEEIPDDEVRRSLARDVHFHLARVFVERGDPESARTYLKEAYRLGAPRAFLEEQEAFQPLRGEAWDRIFDEEEQK